MADLAWHILAGENQPLEICVLTPHLPLTLYKYFGE